MKSILLTLMILVLSHQTFAQYSFFESCEEAEKQAQLDSDNGIFKLRIHGLVDYGFSDFRKFYEIYLYSIHNIEISYEGCIIFEEEICYTKKMNNLMNEKFGGDFIENKIKELELFFPTLSEKDKSDILDLNKIYTSNLESDAKFIGNDKIIANYLKSILQFKETPETYFDLIELTINEKGKIINLEFDQRLEFVDKSKLQLYLYELNKLGDWMPGFIFNTKVKSKTYIIISG
jgi:hypothetical protein